MSFETSFISTALLSLALGGLIGLERERSNPHSTIGLRTFALLSFLGLLASTLGSNFGGVAQIALEGLGFAGALAFAIMFYYFKSSKLRESLGITTALVIPLSYIFGVLVGRGFILEAVASTIAVTLLLAERTKVHAAIRTITHTELVDGLIFAIIAFIVLPLIPGQPQQVLGFSFDLQFVWKIVVIASLLSFAAHFLAKYLHSKGVFLAIFFGGAVSALGVIHLYARKTFDFKQLRFAFVTSSAGAYAADLILLALIAPVLFTLAVYPLLFATAVLFVFMFLYRGEKLHDSVFSKPLSLSFVIEFSLLFFAVKLFSEYAVASLGQNGLLISSFLGGLASSTAVFATIASLFNGGEVTAHSAALSMLLGLAGSFAVKLVVLYPRIRKNIGSVLVPAVLSLAAGAVAFILLVPA